MEAVAEPDFDIDKEYGDDVPKTLLETAVEEAVGQDDFVRVLVSAGARPDLRNSAVKRSIGSTTGCTVTEKAPYHKGRAARPL